MGTLLTYRADESYHTQTNGNYNTYDFTGKVIYSGLDGRFLYGFEVSNGQRSYPIYAKKQDANTTSQIRKPDNSLSLRGCVPRVQTFYHCQDLQVFTECFFISIVTVCPRLLPSFFGDNDVWVGGSSWGSGQPADLLFTATQLLQVQKTFRDNGLFDLYETLQSNQAELRLVYNFLKLNSTNQANITLFKKYLDKGFSYPEFDKLFDHDRLFNISEEVLNNSGLPQSDKDQFLNELKVYLTTDDFQERIDANTASNTGINNQLDPLLDLSALENNPAFAKLTVTDLRALVTDVDPNLEEWKRNISAGRALEEAYSKFVSAGVVTESNFRKGFKYPVKLKNGKTRWVIPDFLHPTNYTNVGSNQYVDFPYGGVVEVKAAQNPITLQTSSNQIEAEIQWASTAYEFCFVNCVRKAGIYNSGSYTLVLPYGGTYSQDIVDECTRKGVNFYVSYAFIEVGSNKVVFSNPERKNNISSGFPYNAPVNINKRITLDIAGSIQRWQKSNNQWDD